MFFRLETRAYQQNALEREAVHAEVPADAELWRSLDGTRREIDEALAELAALLPDDAAAGRVGAATRDWLAAGLRKRLPADQEVVLYRVAQEALSNIAKHAHAGSVRVELFEDDDVVMLVVDDDGVGFDPVVLPQGNLDHFGMASMRERLELAGGTWEVRSRAGAGTTLIATLPRELVPA